MAVQAPQTMKWQSSSLTEEIVKRDIHRSESCRMVSQNGFTQVENRLELERRRTVQCRLATHERGSHQILCHPCASTTPENRRAVAQSSFPCQPNEKLPHLAEAAFLTHKRLAPAKCDDLEFKLHVLRPRSARPDASLRQQ